jgi:hypothetical protein
MQSETENIKGTGALCLDMAKSLSMKGLHNEIRAIRKEIQFLRDNMPDPDTIMTKEETVRFNASMLELKNKKTISLSKVKSQLGLKNAKC